MNIKLKKGLIAHLLDNLYIEHKDCGISQQSYQYLRDGKYVSENTINRLEEKCNILRSIDFPIEGIKFKSTDSPKMINFSTKPIHINESKILSENIENALTENELINSQHIDSLMHRLDYAAYKKIKTMTFSNILWATDIPEKNLLDGKNLKIPPLLLKSMEREKKGLPCFSFSSWHKVDKELKGFISLKGILSKFNEEFLKKDEIVYSPASKDLFSAIDNKLNKEIFLDQMNYILMYLNYNNYEFHYQVQRVQTHDESIKRKQNLVKSHHQNMVNMDSNELKKYFSKQELAEIINLKSEIGFNNDTYDEITKIGDKFAKHSLEKFLNKEYVNPYGYSYEKMCERYKDGIEKSKPTLSFKSFSTNYYLNIVLVKKDTTNFAISEKCEGTGNILPSHVFHSHEFRWNNNPAIVKYFDGEYVPNPVPIVSKQDLDYFTRNNKSNLTDLLSIDITSILDQLRHILNDQQFYKNYSTWQGVKGIDYLIRRQSSIRDGLNIFYDRGFESRCARFDSYLAYLIDYYSNYHKIERLDLLINDVKSYYKIFHEQLDALHKAILKDFIEN